jgi:hypothetical protein
VSGRADISVFETGISSVEMRTATRLPILQRCFVMPPNAAASLAWQCIAYNISSSGVGVALPIHLQAGTELIIQAWGLPRACSLLVRVIHSEPVQYVWFTGCELLGPLSDDELKIWASGLIDWIDDPTA